MIDMKKSDKISLISGGIAVIVGLYCILGLPQDRVVQNLGIFLFKLLPFSLGAIAISFFDVKILYRFKLVFPLMFLGFLTIFAVFVPKIFFNLDNFEQVYYLILMMVPFIILLLTFTFRLGGASTENCLRLAFSLLLLMISGIEDLAFLKINKHTDPAWATVPDVWKWASHIKVRIGHFPTKYEAYVFIAVHFILATLVAFVPFKKIKKNNEASIQQSV